MKMAKRFIHFFVIASTAISLISAQGIKKSEDISDSQMQKWDLYKYEYNREYGFVEDMYRMETFYENLAFIERPKKHYKSVVNNFADKTEKELMALNGFREEYANEFFCKELFNRIMKKREGMSEVVNWAEVGYVSPVQNQGKCASDYAFSAVGALESQIAIRLQKIVTELSVQQVLDCTSLYGNRACKGGYQANLYKYLSEGNGIKPTADYPYLGINEPCQLMNNSSINRIGLSKMACTTLPPGDEETLKTMVSNYGPVPIVFKAGYPLFFYKSGIYNDPDCDKLKLNHPVLLVGYGTDENSKEDYWIIKNSWGADWGEKGYFRTLRNKNNHCGVASLATLPVFSSLF